MGHLEIAHLWIYHDIIHIIVMIESCERDSDCWFGDCSPWFLLLPVANPHRKLGQPLGLAINGGTP